MFGLGFFFSQAQTLTLEITYNGEDREAVLSARTHYRVPLAQRKVGIIPDSIGISGLWTLNTATRELQIPMYNISISGSDYMLSAYDRETDTHYIKVCYGRCEQTWEYECVVFYRRGEYHLQLFQCGENTIISTGNVFLSYIFPKELWRTNPISSR